MAILYYKILLHLIRTHYLADNVKSNKTTPRRTTVRCKSPELHSNGLKIL